MQGRTQRSSFNLEAKRHKKPCDSVGGEQRSILVVGFDSFCPLLISQVTRRPAPQPFPSYASFVCQNNSNHEWIMNNRLY
jgi:hypothetical protein